MAKRFGVLVVLSVVAATLALNLPVADAGGSWLYPVADRYEPGDEATLVGYTGGGQYGSVGDGPFYAYLYMSTDGAGFHPRAIPLYVGELEVSAERSTSGHRVAITLPLPSYLEPGMYWLEYCNQGCEEKLGDLIGGVFFVGIEPEWEISRSWPADEPEIANLADRTSVASGPGLALQEAKEVHTERELSQTYIECVEAAGYELGGVAQVLLNSTGVPYYVKTGTNVPAEFHSPCFEAIGGASGSASSWNQTVIPGD